MHLEVRPRGSSHNLGGKANEGPQIELLLDWGRLHSLNGAIAGACSAWQVEAYRPPDDEDSAQNIHVAWRLEVFLTGPLVSLRMRTVRFSSQRFLAEP